MTRKERAHRRRAMPARKVLWGEINEIVRREQPARLMEVPVTDALQYVLDRAMSALYVAATMADDQPVEEFWSAYYDAQGNRRVEPNKWYQLERSLRAEVAQIAGDMSRLGIAERAVEVEERKAAWVLAAIRAAATDAGLDNDQVRRLGEGIRSRLLEQSPVPDAGTAA